MSALPIPELSKILREYSDVCGRGAVRETCRRFMLEKTLDREAYEKTREMKIPKAWVKAAYERQKGLCPRCGKWIEARMMSGDHRKSVADGGEHVAGNIDCLHKFPCNSAKGRRNLAEDAKYSGVDVKKYLERTAG